MTGPILVADLVNSKSLREHNKTHDAYFGRYDGQGWLQIGRKPFHWLVETPPTLIQTGTMLAMADLFPGARVLDYGSGTGWLARAIACLGCEVKAVDVSEKALEAGRKIVAQDPLSVGLELEFTPIDAQRLPFADEFFDRIVCFSAFHHVADQKTTREEMYRILRKGGMAVFNEPGYHSKHPQSQQEMRKYGVIENDIIVEDIDGIAKAIGFATTRLAYFSPMPIVLDIPSTPPSHPNAPRHLTSTSPSGTRSS